MSLVPAANLHHPEGHPRSSLRVRLTPFVQTTCNAVGVSYGLNLQSAKNAKEIR